MKLYLIPLLVVLFASDGFLQSPRLPNLTSPREGGLAPGVLNAELERHSILEEEPLDLQKDISGIDELSIPQKDTPCDLQAGYGYSPHPTSCNKYLQCVHNKWEEQSCNPNTAWSQSLLTCNWVDNVDCRQYSTPATPTIAVHHTAYACEDTGLIIECDVGHVIKMDDANYGRTSKDICNKGSNSWPVNCHSEKSYQVLTDRCSGQRLCYVTASNAIFGDPCGNVPKYLEVHYFCEPDGCSSEEAFLCPTAQCIRKSQLCDGIDNCGDGDDEICPDGCKRETLQCSNGEGCIDERIVQCPNGRCILERYLCDGNDDCGDGADENCTDGCSSSYQYLCPNGHCIPNSWLCDGEDDCGDRADENDCSDGCSSGAFQCTNGECIRNTLLCDGKDDCGDRADESCPDGCSSYQFQCPNGWCIPNKWLCDGVDNCGDRADESFPDESFSPDTCYKYDHIQKKCLENHLYSWPYCSAPEPNYKVIHVYCNPCYVESQSKKRVY